MRSIREFAKLHPYWASLYILLAAITTYCAVGIVLVVYGQ